MITFLTEFGYTILTLLTLMILWAIAVKSAEGSPTTEENNAIMDSIQHRENSFLMNRTESKWGKE